MGKKKGKSGAAAGDKPQEEEQQPVDVPTEEGDAENVPEDPKVPSASKSNEEEDSDVQQTAESAPTPGARASAMSGKEDLTSQISADHVHLINCAIDRLCRRGVKELNAVPRSGETAAVQAYVRIVRKAVQDGEDDDEIRRKLTEAGVQEEQAKAAIAALRARKDEIRAHMVEATSELSGKFLSDFDWKASITLASSKASSLQIPSLQLALYLGDSDGGLDELLMELDKDKLEQLISAALQRVQPSLASRTEQRQASSGAAKIATRAHPVTRE
eukprot:CAMPEP_0181324424 /NCGR_PEP_ID=MMETSP1101-20121128/20352_1 /TAXON_ID=46948 /ORGANISM="Rhodomonas abbreviata, Strain Caron Lab Isolate" /LENGTH=272 /DNA_ID=CAMNT_0023432599 /DNA_START=13 /DNA_END=832 /DNA_ORIENTATION=-